MFKYIDFPDKPTDRPKSPKPLLKSSSIPKPSQVLERPVSGSRAEIKPKTPGNQQKDNTVSDRYTNRICNRLPSPRERFQTHASAAQDNRPPFVVGKYSIAEERKNKAPSRLCEKAQKPTLRPQPLTRTLPLKHSSSDIMNKKRPLELQCDKSNILTGIEPRTRPKTSDWSRTESRLENKVLSAVKNVLSRAVIQQRKIDETNIEKIMDSMRDSLNLEKKLDDEETSDIDTESKSSRTTNNEIKLPEEKPENKKIKSIAGIVRRDNSNAKPERKPYTKLYLASKQAMNKYVSEGDGETLLCIDLPDLNYPNLTPTIKREKTMSINPELEITSSKQNIQISSSKTKEFSKQFEVGDFQPKEGNPSWNSSDDAKLCAYIRSFIYNMKDQLKSENSVIETMGEIDSEGTVCRSFCVCKVCISKHTQSKSVLKQNTSTEKTKVAKPVVPKPIRNEQRNQRSEEQTKPTVQRGMNNRLRLLKPSSNNVETVIKSTNPNFTPGESSLNTSLNLHSVSKGTSYTVVDTAESKKDSDDMYLQRRISRSPMTRSGKKTK